MKRLGSGIMTDYSRVMDTGGLTSKVKLPVSCRLGDLGIELRKLSRTKEGICTWDPKHSRMLADKPQSCYSNRTDLLRFLDRTRTIHHNQTPVHGDICGP